MAEPNSVPEQENPAASSALPDVASVGVGSALRMRREQLGWTLPQIADWLRIREAYLEALESGRAGVFPAEAYALGFLRTYAQAMGFDAEDVVQRYKREGKVRNRKPELTFPAPPPDRRIPPGVTVSLGLLVLVGAYVGWYQFVGHAPPVPEHVPPVAEIIPGEKTANAPSPQVASILPDPGASPPPQPVAPPATSVPSGAAAEHSSSPETSNAPLGLSPDTGKEASPVTGNGAEGVSPSMAEGQGASPENPEGAASAGVASDQLVVKADAASWVQVKDGAGKVVYDHIMQPGDQWNVPQDNGPYSLTVGNAGGIMVAAGTMITPHLGRNGSVRRKLALTVEAMRDGSLAGAPVAIAPSTSPSQSSVPAPQVSPGDPPTVPKGEVGQQQDRTLVEGREASSPAPDGRKPDAASAQPDQGGVVQENAPAMPIRSAPAPRRKSAPPPETSADDLNARQLQGLGGH